MLSSTVARRLLSSAGLLLAALVLGGCPSRGNVQVLAKATSVGARPAPVTVFLASAARRPDAAKPEAAARAGRFLVCIDPGHPSETSAGAEANGLSENRLNWQVAQRLAGRLHALGIAYCMTKQRENQFVTNRQRAEMANRTGASLFIRLHCDSGSGRGYTWYYPDQAATKYGVTGPPVPVQRASRIAAYIMNDAMRPVLVGYLRDNPVKTDADTFVGARQGGALTGSVFARVPTALIEMCFINQRAEARFIASPAGQEKMADALAAGIAAYRGHVSVGDDHPQSSDWRSRGR
jgi:N-acetylmuramoyl-L-alanine amidase